MRYETQAADVGRRIDVTLADHFPGVARSQVREVIQRGEALVNGATIKPSYKLREGDLIETPILIPKPDTQRAERVDLKVLFEDDHLAIINKPAGMVTHPGKGHWEGTLTAALLARFSNLSDIGGNQRPGIVHRLDRDTSGVLVIAKTNQAHELLTAQFANRTMEKEYFALVAGVPDRDRDLIDEPIGPHHKVRERMTILRDSPDGKSAQTFFEVLERYDGFAAVKVLPKTGRTHQIRVHLMHAHHPVLCDRQYGGRAKITEGEIAGTDSQIVVLGRTALHAKRLGFTHPATGERLEFTAEIPRDIQETWDLLKAHRGLGSRK